MLTSERSKATEEGVCSRVDGKRFREHSATWTGPVENERDRCGRVHYLGREEPPSVGSEFHQASLSQLEQHDDRTELRNLEVHQLASVGCPQ